MRLALWQCAPRTEGVSAALRDLDAAAGRARQAGADLLVTPEMYLTGYAIGAEAVAASALTLDGATMGEIADTAQRHALAVCVGFPERNAGGRPWNAVALVDRRGTLLTCYRKTHLWGDVDRAQFTPGDALPGVVELAGWPVSLAICYDVEFPELVRASALAGAELIVCATASMLPYTTVSSQIVPARAEENEVALAYANYAGVEGAQTYYGLSTVAGPDGATIAQAPQEGEHLLIADLDADALAAHRARIHHLRDRRPDLYDSLTEG